MLLIAHRTHAERKESKDEHSCSSVRRVETKGIIGQRSGFCRGAHFEVSVSRPHVPCILPEQNLGIYGARPERHRKCGALELWRHMQESKSSRVVPRAGALQMSRGANVEDVNEDAFEDDDVQRLNGEIDGEEDAPQEDDVNDAGETMTAFNLREEREDGYFDENGNFVWKEEAEEQDAWVASLTESAMEQAVGEASRRRKRPRDESPVLGDEEALERLRRQLEPGETVKTALRRLGEAKQADPAAKKRFDEAVECSNALLSSGYLEVYDADRTAVDKWLKKFEASAAPPVVTGGEAPSSNAFWEYKGADGAVHGPYSSSQILAWRRQGFFTGEMEVQMRRVKDPAKPQSTNAEELLGDLNDDNDDEASDAVELPGPWQPSSRIRF
eukprot:scaffold464_cov244-Pinguiococcus_pyrenoidosus.AAC.11